MCVQVVKRLLCSLAWFFLCVSTPFAFTCDKENRTRGGRVASAK